MSAPRRPDLSHHASMPRALLTLAALIAPLAALAQDLQPLSVSRRHIVTPDGRPFVIKGVAIDAATAVEGGYGRTPEELARYFRALGLNAFRLAFVCTREAVGGSFPDYLERCIAPVVAASKAAGMRVVLDMHEYQWAAPDKATPGFREQWLEAWRVLCRRYADEPAIAAYELWNEPDITHGSRQQPAEHRPWLCECIQAVREIDRRHIVIVNGVQGGLRTSDGHHVGREPDV